MVIPWPINWRTYIMCSGELLINNIVEKFLENENNYHFLKLNLQPPVGSTEGYQRNSWLVLVQNIVK